MIKFLIIKIIIEKIIRLKFIILKRNYWILKIVKRFEDEFSKYIGKKYGLSFCNGTSSIEAAIYALDLKK